MPNAATVVQLTASTLRPRMDAAPSRPRRRLLPVGVLILVLFVCASRTASAATYYVDYASGSNNNDGLTQATAWKTPPGAYCAGTNPACANPDTGNANWTTKVFAAGDSILLKAGATFPMIWFVQTSHFPANPAARITIGRYGTGADPIIEGGQSINAIEWSTVGANIYAYSLPAARLYAPGTDRPHMYRNGIRWAKNGTINDPSKSGATTCASLSAEGEMFYDAIANRICVFTATHPQTDPDATWLVGFRHLGLYVQGVSNLTIEHIQVQDKSAIPSNFGGEIEIYNNSNNITLDGVTSIRSGGSGLRAFPTNGGITGLTIKNSTVLDSWAYGLEIDNQDSVTVAGTLLDHNTVSYSGDHCITCNRQNGCVIQYNTLTGCAVGQATCATSHCGPATQDRGNGICITSGGATQVPKNIQVQYNTISNTGPSHANTGSTDGSGIYMMACEGTCQVLNNLVYTGNGPGLTIQYDGAPSATPAWKVIGNSLVDNGAAGILTYNGGVGPVANWMTMRNNQIYTRGVYSQYSALFWNANLSVTQAIDHNNVRDAGNPGRNYWCGSGYQTAPCGTWSGTSVDPSFVNPIGGNYHLQASGPSINAGTATCPETAVDLDGTVRPQGAACDIGAFEYSAGGPPPVAPTLLSVVPVP